jgi:transposase-like protein
MEVSGKWRGYHKGSTRKSFGKKPVKLVTEGGLTIPEVRRRLSVAPSTLTNWIKAEKEGKA